MNYPRIDPIAAFTTLSQRASAEVVSENLRLNFLGTFESTWRDPRNLTALGFHSLDGARINGATTANDDQVLVNVGDPVSDIALANRRPSGIAFFEFECTVNFDPLVDERHRPCHLRFRGYLQLRQGSVQVTTGGAAIRLRTFMGPSGFMSLPLEEFWTHLAPDQPTFSLLKEPNLNSTHADVDTSEHFASIKRKVIMKSFLQLTTVLLKRACPDASEDPTATLRTIKQVNTDANGNEIVSSLQVYTSKFELAMKPFGSRPRFPEDVVALFARNLSPQLLVQLETAYNAHKKNTPLDRNSQITAWQSLLNACNQAAKRQKSIHSVVQHQSQCLLASVNLTNSATQSFASAQASLPPPVPQVPPAQHPQGHNPFPTAVSGQPSDASAITNPTFASQAERTLGNEYEKLFKGGFRLTVEGFMCFACMSLLCRFLDRNGNVSCPKAKNDPAAMETGWHNREVYMNHFARDAPNSRFTGDRGRGRGGYRPYQGGGSHSRGFHPYARGYQGRGPRGRGRGRWHQTSQYGRGRGRGDYSRMNASERAQLADALASDASLRNNLSDRIRYHGVNPVPSQNQGNQQGHGHQNGGSGASWIFVTMLVTFATDPLNVPSLPLHIDAQMMHIMLTLGRAGAQRGKSVDVSVGVDTLSAVSIGNLSFLLNLVKRFPMILKQVIIAKAGMYKEILLGGIVKQLEGGDIVKAQVTTLPVLFVFHTPMTTSRGEPVLFQVGAGKDVAVNLIVGNGWLKKTRAKIEFGQTCGVSVQGLSVDHFPGEMKRPERTIPDSKPDLGSLPSTYANVYQALAVVESTFCTDPSLKRPGFNESEHSPSPKRLKWAINSKSSAEQRLARQVNPQVTTNALIPTSQLPWSTAYGVSGDNDIGLGTTQIEELE